MSFLNRVVLTIDNVPPSHISGCLMSMVKMAKDATPSGKPGAWDAVVDQAKEFEPSILNTSVWLMQMVLQVGV